MLSAPNNSGTFRMTADKPPQAGEKARRKGGPRSRTGCSNCKQRRVKCDETPPKCQRCIKRGLECQGVGAQNGSSLSLLRDANSRTISNYAIPFRVPGSQHERQLLHYFCVKAATDLSGYLVSDFWTRIVLRRSQGDLVVRQAVVALASLHREEGMGSASSGVLYNKAMRSMRKYLSHRQRRLQQLRDSDQTGHDGSSAAVNGHNKPPNQTSEGGETDESASLDSSMMAPLICCALFYSFESIQGNVDAAMKHLAAGLNILDSERTKLRMLGGENSDDIQDLEDVFSRLDLQAGIYDETTHVKLQTQRIATDFEPLSALPKIPVAARSMTTVSQLPHGDIEQHTSPAFASMDEAQRYLTELQVRTRQQMTASIQYRYVPRDMLPPQVRFDLMLLTKEYTAWGWRFTQYLSHPSSNITYLHPAHDPWESQSSIQQTDFPACIAPIIRSAMDQRQEPGIGLLYIHYYMFYLILTSGLPDDPGVYTRPTAPDFTQCPIDTVLDMVEVMMAIDNSTSLHGGSDDHRPTKRRISAETGLVATVFLMAARSDNCATVRRALSILERSGRREGLYDARVVAALTKKVMEMRGAETLEKMDQSSRWLHQEFGSVGDLEGFWNGHETHMTEALQGSRLAIGKCFIDTCEMGGGFEGLARSLGVSL